MVPHRSTTLARSCFTSLGRQKAVLSWLCGCSWYYPTYRNASTCQYFTRLDKLPYNFLCLSQLHLNSTFPLISYTFHSTNHTIISSLMYVFPQSCNCPVALQRISKSLFGLHVGVLHYLYTHFVVVYQSQRSQNKEIKQHSGGFRLEEV